MTNSSRSSLLTLIGDAIAKSVAQPTWPPFGRASLLLLMILANLTSLVQAGATTDPYVISRVALGPGGFVTGVVIGTNGTTYAKCDVTGPFRWNNDTNRWTDLSDTLPLSLGFGDLIVDDLAVSPADDQLILAHFNEYQASDATRGLWRSTDGGTTWNLALNVPWGRNLGDARFHGEAVLFDPANPQVVYFVDKTPKLWRSNAAGASGSWTEIATPLSGLTRAIAIDDRSRVNGRSATVYLADQTQGVFRSTNGGDSFTLMPGSPKNVTRLAMAGNGALLATTLDAGVRRWNGTVWQDVSPEGWNTRMFVALGTDPNNRDRVSLFHLGCLVP